jgi:hypothetical protein
MLLTPDGQVPGRSMMPIIAQALARAEMQPWRPQGQQVAAGDHQHQGKVVDGRPKQWAPARPNSLGM